MTRKRSSRKAGQMGRFAGVVLHPTSLPGPRGIGQIGARARAFASEVAAMGCSIWQVLPLGPTSYGDSPYQCLSSFAGNHLIIDLDDLVTDGLLLADDLADYPAFNPIEVDYGQVFTHHNQLLRKVSRNFEARASKDHQAGLKAFRAKSASWLNGYTLYMAIKEAQEGRAWHQWDAALVAREATALAAARVEHAESILHHEILQYLFFRQWGQLRQACATAGVQIMGDIPIFVAHDSADVWANQELFQLDESGNPTVVAGVPPDYFSKTGQLWGNPLYRWDVMKADGYAWWCARLGTMMDLVDLVRIDHFRGFESYWEIQADEETAINGKWVPGPGADLFHAFTKAFGKTPIIAEDLGLVTPEVEALRDELELPGMKVLQFILGNEEPDMLPECFPERSVCYTGTHDNDTTVGWFTNAEDHEREAVIKHLKTDGKKIAADFIHAAWHSPSYIAIAPMQDVFELDSKSRLNLPGRLGGNWRWRFLDDQLDSSIVATMRALSASSGRLPVAT